GSDSFRARVPEPDGPPAAGLGPRRAGRALERLGDCAPRLQSEPPRPRPGLGAGARRRHAARPDPRARLRSDDPETGITPGRAWRFDGRGMFPANTGLPRVQHVVIRYGCGQEPGNVDGVDLVD